VKLEATKEVRHRCIQTSGDHLQRDKTNLALASFEIRQMSAIHAAVVPWAETNS